MMTSFKHNNIKLELVSDGLSFPTSIAFDSAGVPYVAESGVPFNDQLPIGRIWRISPDGHRSMLIDNLKGPVNGVAIHDNRFYISEGGAGGGISTVDTEGKKEKIVDGLPGPGNYHTNMVAIGPDNKLYFSQGAMTNSAVIGLDSYELGWLRRLPHAHDIPGYDIVLNGINIQTTNPFNQDENSRTGAFVPFGIETSFGQRISSCVPCTAGIMKCDLDGGHLELVAWGLRNAYGLGFLPDGRLLATEQGLDDRGSRPVGNAPDLLFEIKKGFWYGWPDFIGGEAITDKKYSPVNGNQPNFLLANHAELPRPEKPLLRFPPNACAVKFDVIPESISELGGDIVVALFGDEKPMTAPPGGRVGRCVACIDPDDWSLHQLNTGPFSRPIDVRFNPTDGSLYVVDFGQFEMHATLGATARPNSGRIWKINMFPD